MAVIPSKLVLGALAGLALATFVVGRPLTAPLSETIEIADMTWIEIRAAIGRGVTTVIVPSGGLEQNGPHMAIAKHDSIVRWTARQIAADLGSTLVAPVISYVPQGEWEPPSGNMAYPGTIGVSEAAFAATLDGIARSLRAAGFKTICFIADHGGSIGPQREAAARLDALWRGEGIRVLAVEDYYAVRAQDAWLAGQGESAAAMGDHAGLADTSELMAVSPDSVTLARLRDTAWSLERNGASGDPTRASAERGRALLAIKVDAAVRQIRAARDTR